MCKRSENLQSNGLQNIGRSSHPAVNEQLKFLVGECQASFFFQFSDNFD